MNIKQFSHIFIVLTFCIHIMMFVSCKPTGYVVQEQHEEERLSNLEEIHIALGTVSAYIERLHIMMALEFGQDGELTYNVGRIIEILERVRMIQTDVQNLEGDVIELLSEALLRIKVMLESSHMQSYSDNNEE